jgi:hypothetical protein
MTIQQLMSGLLVGSLSVLSIFIISLQQVSSSYERKASQADDVDHLRDYANRIRVAFYASLGTAFSAAIFLSVESLCLPGVVSAVLIWFVIILFCLQLYGLFDTFNYYTNKIKSNAQGD